MNVEQIRAELENDLDWRQAELRNLNNYASGIEKKEMQDEFRRAVVVLLYAHFEGYCKFALGAYVDAINLSGICCRDVNAALAAATLGDAFAALRNPLSKCPDFKVSLPDDTALHIFAREREFVTSAERFEERVVKIPDKVVDMESNLKPSILQKNLYRLGLSIEAFAEEEGAIHHLLNARNEIAHGRSRAGVTRQKYEELQSVVFKLMQSITAVVTAALSKKSFLRAVS